MEWHSGTKSFLTRAIYRPYLLADTVSSYEEHDQLLPFGQANRSLAVFYSTVWREIWGTRKGGSENQKVSYFNMIPQPRRHEEQESSFQHDTPNIEEDLKTRNDFTKKDMANIATTSDTTGKEYCEQQLLRVRKIHTQSLDLSTMVQDVAEPGRSLNQTTLFSAQNRQIPGLKS